MLNMCAFYFKFSSGKLFLRLHHKSLKEKEIDQLFWTTILDKPKEEMNIQSWENNLQPL